MARPLRIQAPGLSYHITARGSGRMVIFTDRLDRERFLDLLAEVAESYSVPCHAYCLMNNHYHLVITTIDANVSQAVKQLNGTYGQWWNRRHQHVGHVFQGRFAAQVVQDDSYLLTVCRYVALNPVRARLVGSPEKWPWSSYRATAGLADGPAFLRPETIWNLLGGRDASASVLRYRAFVSMPGAEVMKLESGPVLGDAAFVEGFKGWRERASSEVPRAQKDTRPTLDTVFAGVITREARNRQSVRAHACGHSITDIARYLGLHYGTVSKVLAAAEASRRGVRSRKSMQCKT